MLRPYYGSMRVIVAAAVLSVSLAGCGGSSSSAPSADNSTPACTSACTAQGVIPAAVSQDKQAGTPVDPAIVTADNTFGLNLLNTLLQEGASKSGNTAIAPISASLALQITYNGAAGTTQQAMAQTLQLGSLTTQQLNDDNAALQAALIDTDPQVQLNIANSLWLKPGFSVVPAFVQTDQNYYGATVGSLAGAPDNVNQWVSQETDGLIPTILPPGNYSEDVAIIANAVYFKGAWTAAFDPSQTTAKPFTLGDGSQTSVQMMNQASNLPYLRGSGFQAVRLPYGQGRLSMLVVVPTAGTDINTFVSGITAATIDSWEGQMQTLYGTVSLPRFSTSFASPLLQSLASLGMGVAFDPNNADFSGIASGTFVNQVEHATMVEVDEAGTVAAGATTVGVATSVAQEPAFSVDADHPFFYAIRDDKTGELLFVGVLGNPNGG